MNKPTKIVLGIFTFLPLVLFILSAGYVVVQMFSFWTSQEPYMPMFLFPYLGYAIPFIFLFGLFNLGLVIFYLVNIGQNDFLDIEKKFLWIVVVVTLNNLAMPVYWYVHIWKEKQQEADLDSTFEFHESPGTKPQEF